MRRRRFLATIGASATVGGCGRLPWSTAESAYTFDAEEPITGLATTPDTIYIGGSSATDPGHVTALDPMDGSVRWRRGIPIPGYGLTLDVAADTILVWDTIDLGLTGFDGFGDQPWTVDDIGSFPPPRQGDTIFLHRDATVEAITLADADQVWQHPIPSPSPNPDTPTPELVLGDRLVAATWDGYLTGITTDTGSPDWWTESTNIGLQMAHHDATVFVGGHFLHGPVELAQLDPATGSLTPLHAFDNRRVAPIQTEDVLIAQTSGANGYTVARIDADTGELDWTVTGLEATPTSADTDLVAGYDDTDGRVHVLDTATGDTQWTVTSEDTDTRIDVALTDTAVLVRDATTLTAYDRRTGDQRTQLRFDSDAVGERLLATEDDTAYLVVGSTLYAVAVT